MEKFGFEGGSIHQEGKQLEGALLGNSPEATSGGVEYAPYNDAMRQVMNAEPVQLSEPILKLKQIVHNKIKPEYDYLMVRSAVGTPLDVFHGVDLVVALGNQKVTIDVTSNEAKEDYGGAKADVVLYGAIDEDGLVQVSDEEVERVANAITNRFLN